MGRKEGIVNIKIPSGEELNFKFLNVLEFNSTRKRMSVVMRDMQTQEIILLTKGADSIMFDLLSMQGKHSTAKEKIKEYVDRYATEGLRTLVLTKKVLDEDTYATWNLEQTEATLSIDNRDEKLDEVNSKLEHELELVGSTAIEDRLQEEVPETIVALKEIGVKVWVLTGDKVQTAINIGYSAGLLSNDMDQHVLDEME